MSRPEGFAAVPNWMIRDDSFDIYDIAVYAALASHTGPGGVRPSQATLAAEARCSKRKVVDVLQRLSDRGVVQIVRRRRKGGVGRGNTLTNGYVLTPHGPLSDDDEYFEYADDYRSAPRAHRSGTGVHTATDRSAQESNAFLLIEEEPVEEEHDNARAISFDDFWAIWPRKESKKTAAAAWDRAVKKTDPQVILDAARALVLSPNRSEDRFMPYGASWLNQERWNDPLPPLAQSRYAGGAIAQGYVADQMLAQRAAVAESGVRALSQMSIGGQR